MKKNFTVVFLLTSFILLVALTSYGQTAPTVFTIGTRTTSTLQMSWTAGTGGTDYLIVRHTAPIVGNPSNALYVEGDALLGGVVVSSGAGATTFTDLFPVITGGNATPGTQYYYTIWNHIFSTPNHLYSAGLAGSMFTLAAEPTAFSTGMTFSAITNNAITVGKTSGAGTGTFRMLVARQGSAVSFTPTDGVSYTIEFNSNYTTAIEVGPATQGNKIVGLGNGATFPVSGLTGDQIYHFAIFEFNGASGSTTENYFGTLGTTLLGNRNTEPTSSASGFTFSAISNTTLTLNWSTSGNGDRRIVLARQDNAVNTVPVDFTAYTASANWNNGTPAGTVINTDNYVVYDGTGASGSVVMINLIPDKVYHFEVFEYNGAGLATAAYLTPGAIANRSTLVNPPADQPSGFSVTAKLETGLGYTISYTAAPSTPAGYIVLRKNGASPPASTPVGGTVYSVPSSFGDADVAFVGAALTFNETTLTPTQQYSYAIYSFNGAGPTISYRTASPLTGTTTALAVEPTANPTAMTFSTLTPTSYSVGFTAAAGSPTGYLAIRRQPGSPTGVPVDGLTVPYVVTDPLGDGVVVMVGTTNPFAQTPLIAETEYFYDIYSFNGAGAARNYRQLSPLENSRFTLSLAPSGASGAISATPVANTTNLNINLPNNTGLSNTDGVIILRTLGGTAPTNSGVVDGTAPGALVLPGGTTLVTTTTGPLTASIFTDVGPLLPNTQYSYSVFTYNADAGVNGQTYNYFTTAVSASGTTNCVAPVTQANTLASPARTAATIDLTWNRGSGDKVIVIARQNAANNLPAPLVNGTIYTANPDFGSGSTLVVSNEDYFVVYIGTGMATQVTGLSGNTAYSFAIYEYNDAGGGSNPACYSGSPAVLANVVTTANTATSTIQNGGGVNTISALDDTFAERRDVFTFDIVDQGDDSDITDLLAITFTPGPGNQIPFDAIAGVELIDDEAGGTNNIGVAPVINPASIVFAGPFENGNNEIGEVDEGETKTYTLRAYLKPNLGPALQATIDNLKFVFEVINTNVTVESGDSQLLPGVVAGTRTNSDVTTPPNNVVLVAADRIRRTQDISPTTIPATFPFSTQPIFEATDILNNRDKDFSGSPTYDITVNTNMPNPLGPNSAPMAFSSGLADFTGSGFNFTNLGTSTMTVTANGFTSSPATSSITVTAATTLAGGAIGTTPAGNISNGTTDIVAFGFSLATTGTLLNLTGATVSTTSDPDVVFTNIRIISSLDNDFATPGDNSVPLAVGTTPGNAINFTSFVSALSSTAKYFFVLANVNNSFSTASPALTMSLTIGNVVVSLGGVVGTTQTGPAYTFIDSTPPSIVSITNAVPTIFEGSLIQTVAVRFSESMKVSGADPVLSIDGLFGAQTGGVWSTSGSFPNDTYTATFTHTGTQETIAAAFSRVTTNVPQDLGNNNVTGVFPMSSALSFIVDTTKPTTTGVTALPATVNITASSVTVTATYSEPMNPGAGVAPTITFAPVNGNLSPAGLGIWSGGNTVYTRVYNHNLALETIGSTTASVNGARDVAGNLQTVAGVSPAFLIDMVRPVVSLNVRKLPLAATATNADFVTFTVTFSEPVTGVDAADFLPEVLSGVLTGITGLPRFVTTFSPTVYDVQVGSGISPIVGNGTFRLNVPAAATITDVNGNAYNVLYNSGQQYLIDNSQPTIQFVNINPTFVNGYSPAINGTTPSLHANTLEYIVRFSEPVSGVAFSNFTPVSGSGSIPFPAVSIANSTITPIDDITELTSTSPSQKWKVIYNYTGGSGTFQTNFTNLGGILDVASNLISGPNPTNGQSYTVALDPPPSSVASLSTTANTATSITVNWTDVPGATDYLLILTTLATPSPAVADGTFVPLDIAFGDGTVSQNVAQGTGGSATFSGLTAGIAYNVFIYPYALSPNTTAVNQTCIDYKITSPAILSRRSDFIRDGSFTYAANSNIDYKLFQTANIPTGTGTGSIVLEQFLLRDGSGAADADAFSTSLASLTLDIVNYQNIRQIALYDGLTEIQELSSVSFTPINATTGRIVFNSLAPFFAGDDLNKALSVRASFNQNGIVDNQIITFTVFALAVNGVSSSQLVTTSPVGITSTATVDQNKIEVTAQILDFTSIPATTSINIDFGPIVVEARDNPPYSNRDLDFTGAPSNVTAFSNTRSLTYINSPFTPSPILSFNLPSPGVLTFPSNFQFTSSPTPVAPPTTLQISAGGLNGTSPGIGVISSTESLLSYIPASFIDRIPYLTFQSNPIPNSASSFPIATFELRDGNGTPDLDGANTTISSIQFEISTTDNLGATVLGSNDIQQIALYNAAGLELGEQTLSGSTVTFTIGSPANYITAPDLAPMTTQFTLRATFKNSAPSVRDLDNIQVKVLNVMQGAGSELNTAAGSVTGGTWTKATGAVAGGALTPTNKNIIDVVATRLDFTTQPNAFAGINEPFGSAANPVTPIIKARDTNLIIDLEHDFVANIGTGGAVPSPNSLIFVDGDLSLNGVQYTSSGNGRITITSNGLTSANPPSSSTACTNVEVLNVTANIATVGVIGSTNLAGGAVDKVIFGVTFSAPYQAAPHPDLNKFIISFGNPGIAIKDIFTNFRVFENTSAVFGGPNVTTLSATVTTATNGVPDINGPDLLISFASPRDLSSNKSYFLQVDVVSTASGSTPPVRPAVIDGGFGTPTNLNIVTTQGSSSANVLGQTYTFSAIFPPALNNSYPASGQLNVSINQPTLALTFSVPIWTLDNTIQLFDQTANTPGVPLTATNGQYSASSGGTVNNRVNPVLFTLPTPLIADHVYYVTIPQGIFNGPAALDNVGLMDEAGNLFPGFSYSGTLYFKTASNNPPNLLSAPVSAANPSVTNASVVGATINATFDQPGTAYFIVFPSSLAITPTANEVKGLTVNASRVAQGQFNINQIQPTAQFGSIIPLIPQLTAGTLYDVWISAESYSELNGVPTPIPSTPPLPFGQGGTIIKSGTISGSTTSKMIAGVGTSFTTQLAPGRSLFDITGSTLIGTIATITDNTNLTLTNNASSNLASVTYRASGFEVGATGPTLQFTPPAPSATVTLNQPSITVCNDAFQILTEPIIITESSAQNDFSGPLGVDQTINFVLPAGFVFDVTMSGSVPNFGTLTLTGANFTAGGSPSIGFVGNTILAISYRNNGNTSLDKITISGLRVFSTGSASGNIRRFGGTALLSVIGDLSSVATISSANAQGITFTNSYSIQSFGTTSVTTIPNNFNDPNLSQGLSAQLLPEPPFGDYGPSSFSGAGVNINLLNLSAVTLGTPFNITINHVDNNGCPSSTSEQYTVYDAATAIADLSTEYCTVNTNFDITNPTALATPALPGKTHTVTYNRLQAFYLDDLDADVPVFATDPLDATPLPTDQIIYGTGWKNVLINSLLTQLTFQISSPPAPVGPGGGFDPLNNPIPGREYFNYRFDEATILNAKSIDGSIPNNPYDNFLQVSPQGNNYYNGGSLGTVQFTGQFQSIANSAVRIPLVQNVVFFVPAVPIIETGPPSFLDVTDPLNPPGPGNPPNAPLPVVSSNRGTSVYCQGGGLIVINAYPAASAGSSVGTFVIEDAFTNLPIVTGAFVDNTNGTATLDPSTFTNLYQDIRIKYTYKENNSPCQSIATQIIRIAPNPVALINQASLPGSNTPFGTSYCEGRPIGFDGTSSTIAFGLIDRYNWNFGDATNSTFQNPNLVTGQLLDPAVPGEPAAGTAGMPNHIFNQSAPYTSNLTVISDVGCSSNPTPQIINIGAVPSVAFNFVGISTADAVAFNNNSTINSAGSVSDGFAQLDWAYGDGNLLTVTSGFGSAVTNTYTNPGSFTSDLTVTSIIGCRNVLSKSITILPQFTLSELSAYNENFESGNANWQTLSANAGASSWAYGTPTTSIIKPDGLLTGSKFWTTNLSGSYNPGERSYLYSPSFDITLLTRAMVSFNTIVQLEQSDGVVVQYSVDNKNVADATKVWQTLGSLAGGKSTGFGWYDFQGLPSKPGNQTVGDYGWSGDNKTTWFESKHTLDAVTGNRSRAVFRFALASLNAAPALDGFAMDNFRVGNRTRTVLLENFRNAGNDKPIEKSVNEAITKFTSNNIGTQLLLINYHTGFPGSDPFNLDNTADPSSRALYYGVTKTPISRLDGSDGGQPQDPFTAWGSDLYDIRTLQLGLADIVFDPATTSTGGKINVKVDITPTINLDENTILHMAVIEDTVSRATLPTAKSGLVLSNETGFNFILKKMLPSAVGRKVGPLLSGTKYTFDEVWEPDPAKFYPSSISSLRVIVFVQNEVTKDVYQAEVSSDLSYPPIVTGLGEILISDRITVFPNPADEEMTIQLPAPAPQRIQLQMVDQIGRVVNQHFIAEGERSKTISTRDLAGGIYLLQLGSGDTSTRKKILVVHGK